MRAFITGIAGFAGSHLTEALLEAGWDVAGTILPGDGPGFVAPYADRLDLIEVDVCDAAGIERSLMEAAPTCIFHLAAISFVPESLADPIRTFDVNVGGTSHVLETVRTRLPDARVIVVGSADAYGAVEPDQLPIREEQPWCPLNPYAATKAAADVLAETYACQYNLSIVRARPFNHTGPRQSSRFVCADFARQIACIEAGLEEPVIRVGRLTARRDFSDVRDVVQAYLGLAKADAPAAAYNICSEQPVSVRQVLDCLLELSRADVRIEEEPSRVRPIEVMEQRGSAARLRETIGWRPVIPLTETLADTLAYWRNLVSQEAAH